MIADVDHDELAHLQVGARPDRDRVLAGRLGLRLHDVLPEEGLLDHERVLAGGPVLGGDERVRYEKRLRFWLGAIFS